MMSMATPVIGPAVASTEHPEVLDLIRRAQGGDRAAEDALIRRYKRLIESAIWSETNGRMQDEIRSDVYVDVMSAIRSFNPDVGFRLSTHLKTRLMYGRMERVKKRARALRLDPTTGLKMVVAEQACVDDVDDFNERSLDAKRLLERVIGSVGDERYVKWLTAYINGSKLGEIAESSGVSKQRVFTVCKKLLERIRAEFGDEMAEIISRRG